MTSTTRQLPNRRYTSLHRPRSSRSGPPVAARRPQPLLPRPRRTSLPSQPLVSSHLLSINPCYGHRPRAATAQASTQRRRTALGCLRERRHPNLGPRPQPPVNLGVIPLRHVCFATRRSARGRPGPYKSSLISGRVAYVRATSANPAAANMVTEIAEPLTFAAFRAVTSTDGPRHRRRARAQRRRW